MEILEQIQHYWAIILFCGTIIASWVRYETKLNSTKDCIVELKEEVTKLESRIKMVEESTDTFRENIKVDIQEIKTTLVFIKEYIAEIKKTTK